MLASLYSICPLPNRHQWIALTSVVTALGFVLLLLTSACATGGINDQPQQSVAALAMEVAAAPIPIPNQRPPLEPTAKSVLRTPIPKVNLGDKGQGKLPNIATRAAISTVIGYSTGGFPLVAYHFGTGPQRVAFVGGIHGNEWNSILLAYRAIDYFTAQPEQIPDMLTLEIIPAVNLDGQVLITGKIGRFEAEDVITQTIPARFNQNGVDLNRNWDCNWAERAQWGIREVSGGTAVFSEMETRLLRDFFLQQPSVRGVVFWHSAVPGVFAGGCEGIYADAEALAERYATAADYPYGDAFEYYPITGDVTNWLSLQEIPAITVELATRSDIEWSQNLAGMLATLAYFDERSQQRAD